LLKFGVEALLFVTLNKKQKIKYMGMSYLILAGAIMLASWAVSSRLKSKFEHYSKMQLQNGMSGAEIAEKMLADNGIRDVRVISVAGQLTIITIRLIKQ
jgi:Zn-dependent membrane protease YugP